MLVAPDLVPLSEQVHSHFRRYEVEYLQFAFRWMNNLLMRELPLRCTIRLWDTYQVWRGPCLSASPAGPDTLCSLSAHLHPVSAEAFGSLISPSLSHKGF